MNGPLTALDWLGLLHPVLAILFIYPVAGAAIRLGILAREKRTGYNTALPETVPTEHWQHGRWLVSAMVVASLIAYLESFLRHGADGRSGVLLLAGIGTVIALLALWRVQQPALRASFTVLCLAGLLGLGAQPQIERLADLPWQADFWRSHYWSGLLLTALLLFSLAIRPLISQISRLRRLHVSAMLLACLLFAVVAITGCRDLLSGMAPNPLG
jgi:hypothetical protein